MLERKFFHEVGNYLMMAKGMLEAAHNILQKKGKAGWAITPEEMKDLLHKLQRSQANMEKLEKYVLETKAELFPSTPAVE